LCFKILQPVAGVKPVRFAGQLWRRCTLQISNRFQWPENSVMQKVQKNKSN